jgi:hypothetical protein
MQCVYRGAALDDDNRRDRGSHFPWEARRGCKLPTQDPGQMGTSRPAACVPSHIHKR